MGAVAAMRATQRAWRRPKLRGPDAPFARQAGTFGGVPYGGTDRQTLPWVPEAVGRSCLRTSRTLKLQPTGGLAEQASNTARGTPGNRISVMTIACAL